MLVTRAAMMDYLNRRAEPVRMARGGVLTRLPPRRPESIDTVKVGDTFVPVDEAYGERRAALGSMLAGLHTLGEPRGSRSGLGEMVARPMPPQRPADMMPPAPPPMPMPPRRPADMMPPPPPLPPSRDMLYATSDMYGAEGAPIGSGRVPAGMMGDLRMMDEVRAANELAMGIDAAEMPLPPSEPMVIAAPPMPPPPPAAPPMDDFERELAALRSRVRTPLTPAEARRRTQEDMALRAQVARPMHDETNVARGEAAAMGTRTPPPARPQSPEDIQAQMNALEEERLARQRYEELLRRSLTRAREMEQRIVGQPRSAASLGATRGQAYGGRPAPAPQMSDARRREIEEAMSLAAGIDAAQRPAPPPPAQVLEAVIPERPPMDDYERQLEEMRREIRTPLTPEEARRRNARDEALRQRTTPNSGMGIGDLIEQINSEDEFRALEEAIARRRRALAGQSAPTRLRPSETYSGSGSPAPQGMSQDQWDRAQARIRYALPYMIRDMEGQFGAERQKTQRMRDAGAAGAGSIRRLEDGSEMRVYERPAMYARGGSVRK